MPLDKMGEVVTAHADFQLFISYNPGYQSLMNDLKQSTKQRFSAMVFEYPPADLETRIVATETGTNPDITGSLVKIAAARNLKGHGLDEGTSTRLLVYAANLMAEGIPPREAIRMALGVPHHRR